LFPIPCTDSLHPSDSLHPFAMVAFSCLRFLHTAELAYVLRSLFVQSIWSVFDDKGVA
jgi:hypothetical protein